ncbi:MAG TPA: hypothetical protein DEP53_16455 [Bacteroidetes bacterium]|nr:hypothetical protein [Bacteroidota bacterium]
MAARVRTLSAHENYCRIRIGFDFQVSAALVLGKQIGITLFSWGAVRSGLAALPSSVTWRHIYGVSWLGGIGFTMSLFIAGLAFVSSQLMDFSKMGIYRRLAGRRHRRRRHIVGCNPVDASQKSKT